MNIDKWSLAEIIPDILKRHYGTVDYVAAGEILDVIHELRVRTIADCQARTMAILNSDTKEHRL